MNTTQYVQTDVSKSLDSVNVVNFHDKVDVVVAGNDVGPRKLEMEEVVMQ